MFEGIVKGREKNGKSETSEKSEKSDELRPPARLAYAGE